MATAVKEGPKKMRKKKVVEPQSRGLTAAQLASATPPPQVTDLRRAIEQDGGWILGTYREPIGEHWHILAAIPLDKMERFLDPIIVVRNEASGTYWTPNGHHRTAAMRRLGAHCIVALVLPDVHVAYQILALNTEKAHNLREKSLEVIRMARSLSVSDPRPEKDFALEFEEPSFLTLGMCYEQRGRFSGGAYQSILRRLDGFLNLTLPKALEARTERAAKLLELDDAVSAAVASLKERGFESPYLKAFVVARVNPLRFDKTAKPPFDETLDKILAKARRFDVEKVRADQLAAAGGAPEE